MKYKQISFTLLGLFLIAFLTSGCVDAEKMKQLDNEVSRLNQVIQQKDAEISTLTEQSQAKQNELDSVKKELDDVNQKLNTLTTTPVVPQQ